ncbi:MAG: tRNA pseudouridine(55) synthase TruB [Saprospiraceae bacterium]|nr:tRNA pseudouridine(55) synthase TruB [Saprospiraceae bacterium]
MVFFSMPELGDLVSGTMIMVDKPQGWTSFDVVNKIRYAIRKTFQLKKIKVGHAGTLDPMASGLLIICTGKMTKVIDQYQAKQKEYFGTMRLGATTPTYDEESEIDHHYDFNHLSDSDLYRKAEEMTGEITQTPPIYSAIKKDGVPLYKMARAGKVVEIPKRTVQIYDFVLTEVCMPKVEFRVRCSKGTYIRSLVHEFAQSLGSGAYLTALRRTAIGEYQIDDAWQMDELVKKINSIQQG